MWLTTHSVRCYPHVVQGKHEEADSLHLRATAIQEKSLDSEDPTLAETLIDQANALQGQVRHMFHANIFSRISCWTDGVSSSPKFLFGGASSIFIFFESQPGGHVPGAVMILSDITSASVLRIRVPDSMKTFSKVISHSESEQKRRNRHTASRTHRCKSPYQQDCAACPYHQDCAAAGAGGKLTSSSTNPSMNNVETDTPKRN